MSASAALDPLAVADHPELVVAGRDERDLSLVADVLVVHVGERLLAEVDGRVDDARLPPRCPPG